MDISGMYLLLRETHSSVQTISLWVPEERCGCFEKAVEITDLQSKFELRVCLKQNTERRWEQGGDTKIFQLWWRTQENIFQSQEEVEFERGGTQTPFPPPWGPSGCCWCLSHFSRDRGRDWLPLSRCPCEGSPESLEEGGT